MKSLWVVALAVTATPSIAAEWRYVGRDSANAVHYLDADSINQSGKVVAFWTMSVQETGTPKAKVVELLLTANCADHSYRQIEVRNNPASTLRRPTWLLARRKVGGRSGEGQQAEAGSLDRAIIDMACGATAMGATDVKDRYSDGQTRREGPGAASSASATPTLPASTDVNGSPAVGDVAGPAPSPNGGANAVEAAASVASVRPETWVNLGAAATGQSIAVDASSIEKEAPYRKAWVRFTAPGGAAPSPASYLVRIDCAGKTINSMAFRKHGPTGAVAELRDYGPAGEGAGPIEPGTVMEIAFLALCT